MRITVLRFNAEFLVFYSLDLPDQPAAKKLRRSASVVIDQPGDTNKVLIDHVGDCVTSLEDVSYLMQFLVSMSVLHVTLTLYIVFDFIRFSSLV